MTFVQTHLLSSKRESKTLKVSNVHSVLTGDEYRLENA